MNQTRNLCDINDIRIRKLKINTVDITKKIQNETNGFPLNWREKYLHI